MSFSNTDTTALFVFLQVAAFFPDLLRFKPGFFPL